MQLKVNFFVFFTGNFIKMKVIFYLKCYKVLDELCIFIFPTYFVPVLGRPAPITNRPFLSVMSHQKPVDFQNKSIKYNNLLFVPCFYVQFVILSKARNEEMMFWKIDDCRLLQYHSNYQKCSTYLQLQAPYTK